MKPRLDKVNGLEPIRWQDQLRGRLYWWWHGGSGHLQGAAVAAGAVLGGIALGLIAAHFVPPDRRCAPVAELMCPEYRFCAWPPVPDPKRPGYAIPMDTKTGLTPK